MEASQFTTSILNQAKWVDCYGQRSLVVLVVVESPDDMNEDIRNILVIQRGPRSIPLRPAPYGAKVFTDLSMRDALAQFDMHKHCKPFRMRDCIIRLGFNVPRWHVVHCEGRRDTRAGTTSQ